MATYNKAVYTGTFDPFTNGHLNIVERSLKFFDEVTVLVAVSPTKKPLFSKEERVSMLEELFKDNPKVKVDSHDGLVVEYAKNNNIGTLVRGLRPTGDFENEFQMASMNNNLNKDIETLFLMTAGKHYFVSSTLVKEVFTHGGNVTSYVPATIAEKLKGK